MCEPKVLVVSHNAFSVTNNMGKTLFSLFNSFDKVNLAQLYFHILDPDIVVCKTTFRITDRDVLSSLYHPKKCGNIIDKTLIDSTDIKFQNKIYKYGQKRTAVKLLLRDFMWKLGKWKSKDLLNWLDKFRPNAVFLASGYSMFSLSVALFIAKKYNIPLVTYFCDDYYDFEFSSCKLSFVAAIRINLFRKKVKEIIKQSSDLVFISPSMAQKYHSLFNKNGQVIMTPYVLCQTDKHKFSVPLVISFVGNVSGNRWMTLLKIGEALEKINANRLNIVLNIYSVEIDEDIIAKLTLGDSMRFKGAADFLKVNKVYEETDILLHVESFAAKDAVRVRHSISTKIADCLASNRAFLAVGPKGIASIDYLEENNSAYIIDDESLIEDKLIEYYIDNDIDEQIIKNAKVLAEKNHDLKANSERIKTIFNNIVKG